MGVDRYSTPWNTYLLNVFHCQLELGPLLGAVYLISTLETHSQTRMKNCRCHDLQNVTFSHIIRKIICMKTDVVKASITTI